MNVDDDDDGFSLCSQNIFAAVVPFLESNQIELNCCLNAIPHFYVYLFGFIR